jgi:hypothetical protein
MAGIIDPGIPRAINARTFMRMPVPPVSEDTHLSL